MKQMATQVLLQSAAFVQEGGSFEPWGTKRTFQVIGVDDTTGGTATVLVEVSNDNQNWLTLATFDLAFENGAVTEGFASDAAWKHVRGNVTALENGNAPTVTLIMANTGA